MTSNPESLFDKYPQTELFRQISDICTAVNSVVSTKQLLEVSLKKTLELFDAKRGSIFILDKKGKNLILKIAQGISSVETKRMVKRLGQGIVGQVAQKKEPLIVEDLTRDARFKNYKARKGYKTASFICSPLIVKDELVGVFNIADKSSGRHFKKDEVRLLDFLSSQIALNYRRVDLYNNFRKVIKEREDLKSQLGRSGREAESLKRQICIQEKLATIGKLAGGIAHEFNNPLDGVMRYTNLCLEHIKDDEVVRGYLLEIKHGLHRMVSIVKNLLACSRSDMPDQRKVDFTQTLDRSLANIKNEILYRDIKVEKNVRGVIPPLHDLGLERVLTNLLRNAVEAIGEGGTISVLAEYADHSLTIHVSDSGAGILTKNLDQIFEPFYTTKDIDKGCGLGLTIVGEIVKGYSGKISVDSQAGKGTTFSINLPVEP